MILKIVILSIFMLMAVKVAYDMSKDGKFTAQELAKIVLIGLLTYITIIEANRPTETHIFDQGHFLTLIGGVLLLAGIDLPQIKNFSKRE